ncbi:heavy metal-binding domain-containing protein [Acidiphilium iwatense]|uniref:YbjQ family protein n=1 Tax=Acidiphilium iwatense TaxID=768198 RepID=A0ABS9E2I1_9PROT|nr:heavy metal-binding domain-containing protein [Acidiphilium iwatense]MCF3948250.1 YbjQ family protein [Acidiphilium iwatense]
MTAGEVANTRIARVLAPVYGTSIRSRSFIGNRLGNIRAAFGGNQAGYIEMLNETRDEAIAALQAHAASVGGNAVIAMRFDSGEFDAGKGQSMAEITAYGTAVILEPI